MLGLSSSPAIVHNGGLPPLPLSSPPLSSETFRRLLLEANVLDDARLAKAEAAAQSRGAPLERTIVALNLADEATVWRALAKAHGMKFVDPAKFQPQEAARFRH